MITMQCKCVYGKRQTVAVYVKRYLMKLNLIRESVRFKNIYNTCLQYTKSNVNMD